MENTSILLFNISKESNIWRGAIHHFEALHIDSLVRRHTETFLSSITSSTWLSSWIFLVRLSASPYGTIAVHLEGLLLS